MKKAECKHKKEKHILVKFFCPLLQTNLSRLCILKCLATQLKLRGN